MQQQAPLDSGISLYDQAIQTLRRQLWAGTMIIVLVALVGTRLVRFLSGVESTPTALAIQAVMYTVVILNLLLRNSRYAGMMQSVFLLCVHLVVPTVTLLYGGARGFGDIALLGAIILSAIYGWRRWMYLTFTLGVTALFYAVYLELIGQPLTPFLSDSARFSSIKLPLLILFVGTILILGYRFYSQLLQQHQQLVAAQLQLTAELEQSTQNLTDLSADLTQSRQRIVSAREEERRGLHRDLQHRVAPSLAALRMRTGAARNSIRTRPANAQANLNALEHDIKETLSDVRRFVYALHPPMLDQLGLIGAIQEHVRRLDAPFEIDLVLPDALDDVSASAEISIFRFLQTILDLAYQRQTSTRITLALHAEPALLHVELVDDGISHAAQLSDTQPMRLVQEHFNELGGVIRYADDSGLKVSASIPL